jgi:hypothetical protein
MIGDFVPYRERIKMPAFLLFMGAPWLVLFFTAAFVIVTVAFVANYRPGSATVVLALALAYFQFLTPYDPIGYIMHHPLYAGAAVAIYATLGTVWVRIRWRVFVTGAFNARREAQEKFLGGTSIDQLDIKGREKLKTTIDSAVATYTGRREPRPMIFNHKSKFFLWLTYWPLSIVWIVIDEPVKRFCTWAYYSMAKSLQAVSDRAFSQPFN